MTFREEDERKLLEAFMEWLNQHLWLKDVNEPKRQWLVREFQKTADQMKFAATILEVQ